MPNEKQLVSKSSVDYLRDRLAETRTVNREYPQECLNWANGIEYALKILGLMETEEKNHVDT